MNLRKNKGITITSLIVTVIILLIISGISITGTIRGDKEAEATTQIAELNMVQHAILERYTKAQLTKENLPGTEIEKSKVQIIIDEINSITGEGITLKGSEYKELSENDLRKLGIIQENEVFIVNYKTGEVINKTLKTTSSGKALYIYSKTEN